MSIEDIVDGWSYATEEDWEKYRSEYLPKVAARAAAESPSGALTTFVGRMTPIAFTVPDELGGALKPMASIVDRAVAEEEVELPATGKIRWSLVTLPASANIFECVGAKLSAATWTTLARWLPRLDVSRDKHVQDYWGVGFAALALDERATYRRIAGVDEKAALAFKAGETFEFNMQGLLRHLAAAVETRAALAGVLPAWQDVLRNYDTMREAKTLDDTALLWIARCVFQRVGGRSVGTVARELHASAWQLAGQAP